MVQGRWSALHSQLHNVYTSVVQEQHRNQALQDKAKQTISNDITSTENEISAKKQLIKDTETDIVDCEKKIESLKEQRDTLVNSGKLTNKDEKIKLVIGLCILIPMMIYLFLFYSSTFYSAFFRDFTNNTAGVLSAMFDPNALINAWQLGTTTFCFTLSAPIIFIGLGFSLHYFMIQSGNSKYVKIASILAITIAFDCMLAYKIGAGLHQLGIILGTIPIGEPYKLHEAISDINTWAVIFCGFIVYIIWGIVFDMTMTAYSNIDTNSVRIKQIDKKIEEKNTRIEEDSDQIQNLNTKISELGGKLRLLKNKLIFGAVTDYTLLGAALSEFFSGWIKEMTVYGASSQSVDEANNIYNGFMESINSKKSQDGIN